MPGVFIEALKFAADKHVHNVVRVAIKYLYINHPIKVVQILHKIGNEIDDGILSAAILHDVLEDTCTTEQELRITFGDQITDMVVEVTDDMSLTYDDRKRYQIKKAPTLSVGAKKIKIADKISNIQDILSLPMTWSNRRKKQYFEWSERVIEGCCGISPNLDREFDKVIKEAMEIISNLPAE